MRIRRPRWIFAIYHVKIKNWLKGNSFPLFSNVFLVGLAVIPHPRPARSGPGGLDRAPDGPDGGQGPADRYGPEGPDGPD